MYRQPITLMLLAMIVGTVLFVLGAQHAYAAVSVNVTPKSDIVAESLASNECNSPCSATYALAVNMVGGGSIGKQPDQTSYLHGTLVNLTATANEGFFFSGWGGACEGTGVCSVTMDSAKSVIATFNLISGFPNDAPSLTSAPVLSATAGTNYTYSIVANDPDDGDFMTISAPVKPSWLTLTPTGNGTATLTGMPSSDNLGAHLMRVRVQDASGAFATQAFILIVAPAPTTTSSIQGIVVNREGSGIGGARVTLITANDDAAGASVNSQFTDSNGTYLFAEVQPGDYTITARMDEQAPVTLAAVTVIPGQPATVSSMTLQPGQISLHLPMIDR